MSVAPTAWRLAIAGLIGLTVCLISACGDGPALDPEALRTRAGCDPERVEETDGRRRLALIIGVGEYRHDAVPDLPGPPNDARRIYRLLTDPNGYGFPEANVCLLLDEQATTANFKQAFEQALVSRARPGDVAVFYFAGHGSQAKDKNGDEPDAWDETLMLHDARTDAASDLLDDELNGLIAQLHRKTRDITVIMDSCNSGTATRAPARSTVMARFVAPVEGDAVPEPAMTDGEGDGAASWVPAAFPGLAALTAASDSSSALEKSGRGVFTDALLSVLSQVGERPLTLAQVARQAPPLVAAESPAGARFPRRARPAGVRCEAAHAAGRLGGHRRRTAGDARRGAAARHRRRRRASSLRCDGNRGGDASTRPRPRRHWSSTPPPASMSRPAWPSSDPRKYRYSQAIWRCWPGRRTPTSSCACGYGRPTSRAASRRRERRPCAS